MRIFWIGKLHGLRSTKMVGSGRTEHQTTNLRSKLFGRASLRHIPCESHGIQTAQARSIFSRMVLLSLSEPPLQLGRLHARTARCSRSHSAREAEYLRNPKPFTEADATVRRNHASNQREVWLKSARLGSRLVATSELIRIA